MTVLDVHTSGNGIVALSCAATQETIDAYFQTFTKAQMVARSADPDPASAAYFQAMLGALRPLGWKSVPSPVIRYTPGQAAEIPLVACAGAFADFIADTSGIPLSKPDVTAAVAEFAQNLLTAPPSVTASFDALWSGLPSSANVQVMAVGSIFELLYVPFVPLGWFEITIQADSWRDLLTANSNFSFVVRPVLLTFDWKIYQGIAAQLSEELAHQLADHISATTIDLGSMTLEAAA